ncbi:hypothetical protein TNCV_3756941 [Trichonephila clavipes]|nr:hypothetical protein TNCV_3756941 [Trichonephila clavipes]
MTYRIWVSYHCVSHQQVQLIRSCLTHYLLESSAGLAVSNYTLRYLRLAGILKEKETHNNVENLLINFLY